MSNEELEVEIRAIPHNSKCRYGERGAAAAGAVLKPQGGNYAVLPLFFSRNLHHFCRERS